MEWVWEIEREIYEQGGNENKSLRDEYTILAEIGQIIYTYV